MSVEDGRQRARAWCFTMNNPPGAEPFAFDATKMKFLIYQLENAPTTGTPHFQGYLVWKNPQTRLKCRELCAAHWSVAMGTAQHNITYCSKEPRAAPTVTFGEAPAQGASRSNYFRAKRVFCIFQKTRIL